MQVQLAIYGSSRAWVHVNPQILEDSLQQSTYNFGIDGLGFKMQHLRHRLFVQYNRKPAHIILCIDEHSLQKQTELYNKAQFLPYLIHNRTLNIYLSNYKGFSFPDYHYPLVRYYGQQKAINSAFSAYFNYNKNDAVRIKGYQGQDREWNDDFEQATQAQAQLTIDIDQDLVAFFDDFIEECADHDIKLTLLYTPEYIAGQHFVKNRKEIMDFYKNKAHEHHIRLIDFSNDPLCFDKTYFYNALHLNKRGSDLFSRQLVDSLR